MSERESIRAAEEKPSIAYEPGDAIPAGFSRMNERWLVEKLRSGEWWMTNDWQIWGINYWGVSRRLDQKKKDGYLRITYYHEKKLYTCCAHRLIWQFHHGDIPDGFVINHLNGNPLDNNIANLEVCSNAANRRHAIKTGLIVPQRGSERFCAILTEAIVLKCRQSHRDGAKIGELAREYGVSDAAMSNAIRGKTWKHV